MVAIMAILSLIYALVLAALGAAIASVVWYAYQNQTDPSTWDISKFMATVLLGMIVGTIQWLVTGISVTYENIGPMILAYAFLIPLLQMIVKIIIRAATGTPQTAKFRDVLLDRNTGMVHYLDPDVPRGGTSQAISGGDWDIITLRVR